MSSHTDRIQERILQAERDIAELEDQVAEGEMDPETAARLQAGYLRELEELRQSLAATPVDEPSDVPAPATPVDEPSDIPAAAVPVAFLSGRRLAGIAILLGAAVGLLFAVTRAVDDPEQVEAPVALEDVTVEEMERVVAENPDIAPMRLALADRYFAAGDFSNAATHYLYVLDNLGVEDPVALANVGWMTYLSGAPDVALSFVERSLELEPDGGVVFWYLANIRFEGLGDGAGAVEPLEKLLAYDNLPDELRVEAEDMLAEVAAAQ